MPPLPPADSLEEILRRYLPQFAAIVERLSRCEHAQTVGDWCMTCGARRVRSARQGERAAWLRSSLGAQARSVDLGGMQELSALVDGIQRARHELALGAELRDKDR